MPVEVTYSNTKTVTIPYEQAIERVTAALKEQGFGVLTRIDVKDTLQQKLGVDFRRYIILGACNPPLAYRALQAEPEVGLLLPCNVIVYEGESDGESVVSIIDPMAMMQVSANPELAIVAADANTRLHEVLAAL